MGEGIMDRIFKITTLNIISVLLIIIILIYRRYAKIKLRKLDGSGRLTEINALRLQREYCLMGISIIFVIDFMARLMYLD